MAIETYYKAVACLGMPLLRQGLKTSPCEKCRYRWFCVEVLKLIKEAEKRRKADDTEC